MPWLVVGSIGLAALLGAAFVFSTESLALATVLVSWAVISLTLIGLGSLVARALGPRPLTLELLAIFFWLGWCACVAFLQVWHAVVPVNEWAGIALLVLGAA